VKRFGIVLAAGQGKRMKSKLYKVLHPVCEKPMVGHVVDTLKELNAARIVAVVGHGAEAVQAYLGDKAEYALQAQQCGTGHAVMQVESLLANEEGMSLVICGDTPLITKETLEQLFDVHVKKGAAATLLSAILPQPAGYGRIVRDANGSVLGIVEHKDCNAEQLTIQEINAGTYCFDNRKLFEALKQVTNNNAQGEYYLTDVIAILQQAGETIAAHILEDPNEATGVNDRAALAEVEHVMRARINRKHMLNGVTFIDSMSTYIGTDVAIGSDSVIHPGTVLSGKTVIGQDCEIGPSAHITDCTVDDAVSIRYSTLVESKVGKGTAIGPYAYLRPGTEVGQDVKVGDFVELKNAKIDDGSKISHLSYVGDAVVGKNVNIGCGAITVNYDGFTKSTTEIHDDAFVGSNVNLIAPIVIGKGAYVVAGSTVTSNVGEGDLAIARERQVNKQGYATKLKGRLKAQKNNK
jgi:bifunctional UDP-N-acetylglucosamine pyrophosphorylase/glucosamine-1-phosphate N-acetyltransferase